MTRWHGDLTTQEILKAIHEANELRLICRNGVYPRWNQISIGGENFPGAFSMTVYQLLKTLGFGEDVLPRIYEYNPWYADQAIEAFDVGVVGFEGRFTKDGVQVLADMLGKTVVYFRQPTSEQYLDLDSRTVFTPRSTSEA